MKPLRVWTGAVLVVLGLLWLLDGIGVLGAGPLLTRWWPVAVIGLGALAVVSARHLSPGPVAVVLIGTGLLASRLAGVHAGRVLWPAAAVAVGLWLVVDFARQRDGAATDAGERQDVFALLGGSRTSNHSPRFRHADVAAVFGGATLDLRDAGLAPGARVDALALFGGVEVVIPAGWRVQLSGLPVFGGYQDKTIGQAALAPDAPVLTVVATAMFGGVEVKNPPPAASPPDRDAGLGEEPAGGTTVQPSRIDLR